MRKASSALVLPFTAAFVLSAADSAHATCGSTACFLNTLTQDGPLAKHAFRLDLSYRYVDQSRKRAGSSATDEVVTPGVEFATGELEPNHHRELRTGYQLVQADMSFGLTEQLTLLASIPLLSVKHHEHIVLEDDEETFSDADGTTGFGDVQIGARYSFLASSRDLLLASAAIKLPTGPYEKLDSEGEITEPTLQPGTGSTDVLAGLIYSRQLRPNKSEVFLDGSYRWNSTSSLDYRMGDEFRAAAGLTFALGGSWIGSMQLNLRHGGRDRFVEADVPSTGSTLMNVTPGLRFQASPRLALYAFVPVPIYQRVNEAQLAPKFGVVVGLSRRF